MSKFSIKKFMQFCFSYNLVCHGYFWIESYPVKGIAYGFMDNQTFDFVWIHTVFFI